MGQDQNSAGPDHGQFDKTRWSMVLQTVQSQAPGAPKALAELCGRYWRPLYASARRRGCTPWDAQDLVQGFFGHLIGSRGLATVDRWANQQVNVVTIADQISKAAPDTIFGMFLIALMYLMPKGVIGLLDFIGVRLRRAAVAKRQN